MADDPEKLPRGVAVSRRREAPPWDVEAGAPAHAILHAVVEGTFQLAEDERPLLALEPGDVVLVGAGRAGEARLRCVAPLPGAGAEHGAPAELISAAYAPDAGLAVAAPVVHLPAARVRRERGLSTVVSLLRAALVDPSPGQERLARSLLDPLLAFALHCHAREPALHDRGRPWLPLTSGSSRGLPLVGTEAREPADPRIARALDRLRSKLAEPWTVAALARAAGLSRAAFARRFLSELGVPPLRYLAELRMERAARLLAEGDGSLAFVAAEIGYESEFAFGRAFKRHTGEAPGAYRRRRRAERATLRASALRAAA